MKNILICDLFYHVTLNIVGLLPKISTSNKYVLVVVDHYFKWCEVHPVKEHDVAIATRFFEEEIICYFGVPKYIFIDNGSEWMKKFDALCQDCGIIHQFITPAWP
jgi:hypothetical protein